MTTRRDFLRQGGAALGAAALTGGALAGIPRLLSAAPAPSARALDAFQDPAATRALMADALAAARAAGAQYADVRVSRQRQNFVFTREQQIQNVVDTDTIGVGVRALVDGTWGFAATRQLTKDGAAGAAREAVAIAKATRVARDRAVEWLPSPAVADGVWKGAYTQDPWDVPLEQKADLLLRANAGAMKAKNVKFVFSGLFFVKDERNYANTDGSVIRQDVVRSWPLMTITAVSADFTDFQNRGNVVQPMGRGWEYVLESDLVGNAARWGEEASAKLGAKPVDVGRYDLVLDPGNLWLTIHESIGHPTELDRAMGYEANYAGTSFIAPPEDKLGKLKYGPEFMNVQGDRSQEGGLSTVGWDDDGVKPDTFLIVKNGMFNDYQTTREQAPWLRSWYQSQNLPVRSHGCSYAQGWNEVQFQRMCNVSLMPGERDLSQDDLVAATDRGILIVGDGSFSIDQQRYNAQFGGQVFHEIRGGKIVGQLKDVAYQIRTPDFWNAMDMIGGRRSYRLGGSFFDGKGQPPQVNAVSHGSPPARFRNVNVINTGRKS
ncbi:TldD/PmbA family protein [Roseisolibacter sp. H3M3-2]|uniref:TldD/PmbA family protein n=1 Tax=Roseisolibacter sp. H3M3-2 TaxID=3031323 RepID=UPI0023DA8E76|nr:TldD/PmbA family protein [Roseisolibacter sp. H3M3-2]MDF1504499.1 TldD/PmbA family protein [Roseisolibacter sp. H3M3-2]